MAKKKDNAEKDELFSMASSPNASEKNSKNVELKSSIDETRHEEEPSWDDAVRALEED